ncbi:hypothetical protein, partial [Gallaecimonas xiamenensis]|uniref:hypothetical protein n=1 Tax=Gallaecimonas xiamenensis TaxID=1207039 RepID=UPI001ED9A692
HIPSAVADNHARLGFAFLTTKRDIRAKGAPSRLINTALSMQCENWTLVTQKMDVLFTISLLAYYL